MSRALASIRAASSEFGFFLTIKLLSFSRAIGWYRVVKIWPNKHIHLITIFMSWFQNTIYTIWQHIQNVESPYMHFDNIHTMFLNFILTHMNCLYNECWITIIQNGCYTKSSCNVMADSQDLLIQKMILHQIYKNDITKMGIYNMRWLSQQFKILKPQNLGCPFQWYFVWLYIAILSHVTLAMNFDSVQVQSSFGIMWNWWTALCLQLSLISLMRSNVFYLRIKKTPNWQLPFLVVKEW